MSTVTLSFDTEDTKPTYSRTLTTGGRLPDPVGGPPDPETLHRHTCDWCALPIAYRQTEVAILQSRVLWGYVHDGCLDALKAACR